MSRATIDYRGVTLTCTYEYTPEERETRVHPGHPAIAEMTACVVGGVDIWTLLTGSQREEIETLICEGRQDTYA